MLARRNFRLGSNLVVLNQGAAKTYNALLTYISQIVSLNTEITLPGCRETKKVKKPCCNKMKYIRCIGDQITEYK